MKFKIIQANAGNLEQLVELFDAYRVWYGKASDKAGASRFLSERLTHQESTIFACELEAGTLTGFTQLYPLFSSTRMKRLWLLNDLFVAKEFRGQGISKLLIERAKQLAEQTHAAGLLLETEKTNEIGNQLYPSAGFNLEANNFYFWSTGHDH